MDNQRAGLVRFWKERFGEADNTCDWFNEFSFDLSSTASMVKIDWDKSNTDRFIPGKMLKNKDVKHTDSKQRHFMELNWREARNGVRYPVVQFTSHVDGTEIWNGYAALIELYEREGGQFLSDIERDRINAERAVRQAEQDQKKAHAEKLERIAEKHKIQNRAIYHHVYQQGDFSLAAIAGHPYAIKKGMDANVLANVEGLAIVSKKELDKRVGFKRERNWFAIPMQNLAGEYCGQQRIYENGFKAHATGSDMSQAHFILGDVNTAQNIDYVEGFATGTSILKTAMAEGRDDVAIIVCFDKNGLGRIVAHYQQRFTAKTHTIRADNDHFKFLAGKGNAGLSAALELQGKLGVKVTFPTFDDVSIANEPTDFNDLEMLGGQKLMAKQLWGRGTNKLVADKNMLKNKLQHLALAGDKSWKKIANQAVAAGAMYIPDQMDRTQVMDAVMAAVPAHLDVTRPDRRQISKFLTRLVKRRFLDAAATKNFSDDVKAQPNVNYINVKAVINENGHPVIPSSVLDMVKGLRGCTILKASHGSGKTQAVMGPLMRETQNGAAMIVHRITLANQMANELDLMHYKDLDESMVYHFTKLVSCVNSIIHAKFNQFFDKNELLCIDEATQVLRHCMGGKDAIHAPVRAYNKLLKAARNADKVLLADADANDSLVQFLEQARPGEMINIIHVESPAIDLNINYCSNTEFVYEQIMKAARRKSRFLVATDYAKKAAELEMNIRQVWPEAKILLMTGETKGDADQLAFSNDPNVIAANYDVLIYSPVISSGVSITNEDSSFAEHFGLFHGVVVPSDILQMIRRDRNAKQFMVGFKPSHSGQAVDQENLFEGLVEAYKNSAVDMNWEESSTSIAIEKTPFDDMYLNVRNAEARSRSAYIAHALMLFAAEGWKITRMQVDEAEAEQGAEMIAMGKELFETQREELVMNTKTATEDEYKQLKKAEFVSQEQNRMMVRYEIENNLGVAVDADSIKFHYANGLVKVKRLEMIQADYEAAAKIENWEQEQQIVITQRKMTVQRWNKLQFVFKTLGLDVHTGAGDYSIEDCRKVMNHFTASDAAWNEYNALRIGPQSEQHPTCATRFVKAILERFAPVVQSKKLQGVQFYQLNEEKFSQLNYYINARSTIGQNSMIQDELAEYHDDNRDISSQIAAFLAAKNTVNASNDGLCSEGGENIEYVIYNNGQISPEQKHVLLSVISWLKTSKNNNQSEQNNGCEQGLWAELQAKGLTTMSNLMKIARGWLDPQCLDTRWGQIAPISLAEV